MKKLRLLLALLIVSLPLLLSTVACDNTDCESYCRTYWASDPAQYEQCMADCAR